MNHSKTIASITSQELAKRLAVWIALSKLYLDTELQEKDYEELAILFHSSGYSLSEIKEIHRYEVFPVLKNNLTSVAGVWDGFDPDWLQEQCSLAFTKRNNNWYRWRIRCYLAFFGNPLKADWHVIEQHLHTTRHNS